MVVKKIARRGLIVAAGVLFLFFFFGQSMAMTITPRPVYAEDIFEPLPSPPQMPLEQVVPVPPDSEPAVTAAPSPEPLVSYASATWYCLPGVSRCTVGHSGGLYAAISPDLRWLGGRLRVCSDDSCVVVFVIDCNCQAVRGIDLYADAFSVLAPLSVGRMTVTLTALP